MALTQVRVKLEDSWTVLSYNAATGRYEGTLTAPGSSINQPGGYYALEAEAVNSEGRTAVLSGAQYHGLRLAVRETTAPTVLLVSPAQGWLTASAPTFRFHARDEAGGSGIDPQSAKAAIDGVPAACTLSGGGDGYTITFGGTSLSEGPHVVSVTISDRDGNETTASAAYTVDTVPPELYVRGLERRVVDVDRVEAALEARDAASPSVTVTVANNGQAVPSAGGRTEIRLKVGENRITITARDQAGLTASRAYTVIRLITDRTAADGEALLALIKAIQEKGPEHMTAQEKEQWGGALRGGYDWQDFNRVGAAVDLLTRALAELGYDTVDTSPKTDWSRGDAQTRDQMETYLGNVEALRDAQGLEYLESLPLPQAIPDLTLEGANQIEKALVEADAVTPRYRAWSSGEISCGGV